MGLGKFVGLGQFRCGVFHQLVLKRKGVKGGKSRGLQVGFENEVGSDFVHLFLAFLVTQVCIAKHTVGQSGCVAFIEQSHWQVSDVIQP